MKKIILITTLLVFTSGCSGLTPGQRKGLQIAGGVLAVTAIVIGVCVLAVASGGNTPIRFNQYNINMFVTTIKK